jgi:RNA polymerase sigma-70 factor (ECF subfamily)
MAFVLPDIDVEDRLLALARRGNKQAIGEIYEQYFPSVYQFLRLHVELPQTAEDLASEVFFALVDHLGKASGPQQSLRGWLFKVARNKLFRLRKRRARMPVTTLDDWLPANDDLELDLLQLNTVEQMRIALRQLVPEQQEVLILRFSEELSLEETAQMMDKSVSAVKSLQFRAIESMRRVLRGSRDVNSFDADPLPYAVDRRSDLR